MNPVTIGLIGTGNISEIYLANAKRFPELNLVACADINMDAARAKAEAHGIAAVTPEALLADPAIEIVLNLTTPQHHVPVGLQVLAAGKHLYAEKPLAVTFADGQRLMAAAESRGLRVGSAPDTFLGGSHQTARSALDAGAIGAPRAGACFMMVPGHELWHPNPDFYYADGGGPMLDMGPYYITCLVNLLGPVAHVTAAHRAATTTRQIASGPRAGEVVPVTVPTHISAILGFASGPQVTLTTSFDVWKHDHNHIEIYGDTGSMIVPDPNRFDGSVMVATGKGDWHALPMTHDYGADNWRILGLADMARAIREDRPHRASGALALHVLEVMEAALVSGTEGRRVEVTTQVERPAGM
jgi:predicted dehydrogenase